MRSAARLGITAGICALLCVPPGAQTVAPQISSVQLGAAREIAPGLSLFHLADSTLLEPAAPVSIWLLRIDPRLADIRPVLANDRIVDTETVSDMASRYGAVAAVNAGFFLLPSGDPSGVYKLKGQLVSDSRRPRGAVGIVRGEPVPRFVFGRVAASMKLRIRRRARPDVSVDIAGVDTTRLRGKLMLFTPAYDANTGTASGGLEWILDGDPLRVRAPPLPAGRTPIPANGFVLSYGGSMPPKPLTALRPGTQVDLETVYAPLDGRTDEWAQAEDIIGGAGLLAREGHFLKDWTAEALAAGFAELRHPRTLIGVHADGAVWLVTVDGRQPHLSAGMTLGELRELARRLGLTGALNLDGGGSTTMWVGGAIVNSPSDAAGPRKVSDALLVMRR